MLIFLSVGTNFCSKLKAPKNIYYAGQGHKEVVVRLIIDQPGWLLYPDPILRPITDPPHTKTRQYCTVSQSLTEGDSS